MIPSDSGPTPLNPRGGGGDQPSERSADEPAERPAGFQERSESAISNEAQAVRTLASAHRLAGEIENEARRRADEIVADAELRSSRSDSETRARAEAMIVEARAERDRIWEQIRLGVGRATRQIGDLLRIREELRLDLKEAVGESQSAISRLSDGEDDAASRPSWLPGGTAAEIGPPHVPSPPPITGRASEVSQQSSPLSPRSPGTPAPPPAHATPPSGPVPPSQSEPEGAEALSSLRAGPFESFLEVMRFERELASLDALDAVYVRRFSNGEVDVEVDSAAEPDELVEALRAMERVAAVQVVGGTLRVRIGDDPKAAQE